MRNEYFYKNTLLNKLMIGNFYIINTTTTLAQIPVGNAKPDFILINGIPWYMKSKQFINFDRLENPNHRIYRKHLIMLQLLLT